ncbi:alpha/beta fold hydrolase [Streptomyces sp. CBMA152]|uniref:alpha/beta fold hydrolase n=1 Tax=Streptomyces sp. CBMA152 TaxID=1896312 RepID=UPI0016603F5D|nr:alpha/beta hydrolase [Streptomyces sp. CBMA152]MBD0743410.1 alpha/beta hydrolase [Streptomyces sp. CBMA152]
MTTLTARRVPTARLTQHILEDVSKDAGEPVVFVHGNVSSSVFWQDAMLALPERYRPIAVDLRGFGGTDPLPVDATRGLCDYADDLAALLDALHMERTHLVGWSMGGGVVLQHMKNRPAAVRSLTLVNPVSPYGFGGTHGVDGRLNSPDGVGSGGGTAHPDFVRLLAEGDRGEDSPLSPRTVLTSYYVKPPLRPEREDEYVESMLSTRVGDDHYPGDSRPSRAWPGIAPGTRGVLNCLAPTRFRVDDLHTAVAELPVKPPVTWVRGEDDVIVSDTSLFDLAHLGAIGAVPGWDGTPAQPMVGQTRHVLGLYARVGGRVREVTVPGAGHAVHVERPKEFGEALLETLAEGV